MSRAGWFLALPLLVSAACASGEPASVTPTSIASLTATATAMPMPSETATPTATPSPTPEAELLDIRVTHLRIPALGIDSEVQGSEVIPDTTPAAPGCPAKAPGGTTFTVPQQGITAPVDSFEGLANTAWIFGHSRWAGVPGVFFVLEDIAIGDELFVDGVDRTTGEAIVGQRYVVDGIYLTDTRSGGDLVTADTPEEVPARPTVFLQTSVRERGPGKQWILSEEKLMAKAENLVEGDLADMCKYLLLFVQATAA